MCPPLFVVSLRQGHNVDRETVLVMLVGGLAIADRRPLALGITVAVGATIRESALFLIPFAYAYWAARRSTPRRSSSPPAPRPGDLRGGADRHPDHPTAGRRRSIVEEVFDDPGRGAPFSSFGPLWFAAPFALPTLRHARRLALFGCCVLGFLFARDWGRVTLLSAPVIYVAAAHVLDDRRRLAIAAVAAFVALDGLRRVHAGARREVEHRQRAAAELPDPLGEPGRSASGSGPSP